MSSLWVRRYYLTSQECPELKCIVVERPQAPRMEKKKFAAPSPSKRSYPLYPTGNLVHKLCPFVYNIKEDNAKYQWENVVCI